MELFDYLPVIVVALVLIAVFVAKCYIKAPPNVAYIISGIKSQPRIFVGSGGFYLPLLERIDWLFLGQLSVDIKTEQSVPTNDFINVSVDAVAKVMVGDSAEDRLKASRNFLNMRSDEIAETLKDSLEGNMREIIGTLSLKDINTDRDSFSDQVMAKAATDMKKLGIEVISCNIQNVSDENGLIENLGADNTARIRKDASIAKAMADRDVAIAQAKAAKEANDAKVAADLEIAQKQNDLAIRQAELKQQADIKKAVADAAYEIQRQEQEKSIQEATVNAQIKKAEREADLRKQEVEVREQELAAEIQKKADADKYAVEKQAEAELTRRTKEAEANLIEQKKNAEAIKARGEAEAAAIRAKGEAEAAAIKLKGEAEAAAMDKKAEAYAKYNKAAIAEMAIRIMPEIAGKIAEPLSQIDKITVISGGNGANGVGEVANTAPLVMARLFETMKETTGVDLGEILRAQTYDAKVNKNINISGLDNVISKAAPGTQPSVRSKEEPDDFSSAEKLYSKIRDTLMENGVPAPTTQEAADRISDNLLSDYRFTYYYDVIKDTLPTILLNLNNEAFKAMDLASIADSSPEKRLEILDKILEIVSGEK